MNAQIQAIITEYAAPFTVLDFYYCKRCRCIMLESRCKERLEKAIRRNKSVSTVESMDVNCLQCEQGRDVAGLWLEMPYKVCSVLSCRNAVAGNGLCGMHYTRLRLATVTKRCCTCGNDVALRDYHRKVGASDGLQSSCKECMIKLSLKKWKEGVEQNEKNRD